MNSNYIFCSNRLGFRKFNNSDVDSFFKLNSDSEVMKYFPSTLDMEETQHLIKRINLHIEEHGFGFFAVDLLESNTFVGFIGLKKTKFTAEFTPCVEVGWRLDKTFWNNGLATEGAQRCLEFAFSNLKLKEVYSFTPLLNLPSERVMQKIGMQKIDEFEHPLLDDFHPLKRHCLYKTTNSD